MARLAAMAALCVGAATALVPPAQIAASRGVSVSQRLSPLAVEKGSVVRIMRPESCARRAGMPSSRIQSFGARGAQRRSSGRVNPTADDGAVFFARRARPPVAPRPQPSRGRSPASWPLTRLASGGSASGISGSRRVRGPRSRRRRRAPTGPFASASAARGPAAAPRLAARGSRDAGRSRRRRGARNGPDGPAATARSLAAAARRAGSRAAAVGSAERDSSVRADDEATRRVGTGPTSSAPSHRWTSQTCATA